jgi:formate-dependent nitrite reductase membrane component NrfD
MRLIKRTEEAPAEAEDQEGDGTILTYYRYPSLKKPQWTWEIVLYFFLGGLAAGSYLVATLAGLFGRPEDRGVARSGRYIAAVTVLACPLLLVADLGRPERFVHMMRIVKTRSPMSMGTWGLSAFAVFASLGAIRELVEDGVLGKSRLVTKPFTWVPLSVSGVLGSLAAYFVSSYTGVLLSFTNVPLWAKNRRLQGPLFLTSALSTGLAAISLVLGIGGGTHGSTHQWLGRAETAATIGELALIGGTCATLGPLAQPLTKPPYALPFWLGAVGFGHIVPAALRFAAESASGRLCRILGVVASVFVLAGGLIFRWTTVEAGKSSVDDPIYYLQFTKAKPGQRR